MTKAQEKTNGKTGNPFVDGAFGKFADFGKLAEQFAPPGVQSKAFLDGQRRNVAAMAEANRLVLEGVQAFAQLQAEFVRQAFEETSAVATELAKPGQPAEKWATQAALVKGAYVTALANARELAEIGAKSNHEASEVLTHRVADGLDEIKGAFKQGTGAS